MTTPRLAHVVFMTRRYEEMIAWYQEVFQAWIVHQDPALTFMTFDEEHHRFAFANLDILKPAGSATDSGEVGVNHVAFTFASAGELLENYERLKSAGITPYWPVHHGFTLSLYYQDPDGNRHEFQVESCDAEEASAFMRGELFAANPIGVSYDPDDLLARYRAGASEAELLERPDGPPSPPPVQHGIS
jgi:catechol-2,3-dioxygenase